MLKSVAAPVDIPESTKWSLVQPGARRSLVMLACGAVIGLAIAGFGLFTAKGTAVKTVPPEDAALVNQKPIIVSDFVTQLQSEFGVPVAKATEAQKRKVLNDMINEELMVQRGLEIDLPGSDPDVRAALVGGVELQNSANVIAKQPTQAEMLAYYTQHKDRYRTQGVLTLHDLVLAPTPARPLDQTVAVMQQAAAALRGGATVDAVKAKFGLAETGRVKGEELDFAAKIHLGDKLYKAVMDAKAGEVTDPVVDKDGVHVMQVGKRIPSVQLTLEQAGNQVFTDFKKDAQQAVQDANIRYLRAKAQILTAPGYAP
ncbi:MAG: peptidyl-prolyl cis-trans isomerase [Caulobacteraceae bacterium]|nr:peptidyl-prolyl cis-trans isomerase [Caulobacteraceae bacterium]